MQRKKKLLTNKKKKGNPWNNWEENQFNLFKTYTNHQSPMRPSSVSSTKIRPAKRLMEAGSKCSTEGMAYGNCILNNYTTMNKDMCGKEFAKFKSCVSEKLSRK